MSAEYTKPRPEWVKFNFRDLTTSLKWKRMTLAQRGAYITLLAEQALNDCLPNGPEDLACVIACTGSNISEAEALEAWGPPLEECFTERDGGLGNPRMDRELGDYDALVSSKRQKKVEAGKKGASKRWQKDGKGIAPDSTRMAKDALDVEGDVDLEETKTSKRERKPAKAPSPKKQTQVDLISELIHSYQPVWVRDLALEWAEYRDDPKTKAKGIALVSWKKNIAKLAKLPEAVARDLIDAMIAGNWMGPVWENAQQAGSQAPSRANMVQPSKFTRTLSRSEKNGHVSTLMRAYAEIEGHPVTSTEEMMRWGWAKEYAFMPDLDQREAYKPKQERQPDLIIQPDLKQLPY